MCSSSCSSSGPDGSDVLVGQVLNVVLGVISALHRGQVLEQLGQVVPFVLLQKHQHNLGDKRQTQASLIKMLLKENDQQIVLKRQRVPFLKYHFYFFKNLNGKATKQRHQLEI